MTNKVLSLPSRSNKQIQEYASAYERGKKSIFVYKTDKGWAVKTHADKKHHKYYGTQLEATKEAKKQAKEYDYFVYYFKANGDLKK
jgi:hypothetical protein